MAGEASVVHESEAQRQHVRIQVPIELEIAGKRYAGEDWSNGGVALLWPAEELREGASTLREGTRCSATIYFPFSDFNFNLPVEIEVRYILATEGRVGCRFLHLSPRQISLLQFFVQAYVTGEIVQAGDIMDVVARNNFTARRKTIPSEKAELSRGRRRIRRFRRALNWLLIMVTSGSLLAYIGMGIYERNFLIHASYASVATDKVRVEAPKAGALFFQPILPGDRVAKGVPLVMVRTDNGNMESLDSPCDCILYERLADNNQRVATGDPVLNLYSAEAEPYIEARVNIRDAVHLKHGARALLSLPGQNHVLEGSVANIIATRGSAYATARIKPLKLLPPEVIGSPAEVRILR